MSEVFKWKKRLEGRGRLQSVQSLPSPMPHSMIATPHGMFAMPHGIHGGGDLSKKISSKDGAAFSLSNASFHHASQHDSHASWH